ncbi:hypothetical protein LguiA_033783 [Lonicera macranthoides]
MRRKKRKAQSQTQILHHNHQQEEQKCEETREDQEPVTVPYLPTHIVLEILSRVPIKTIFNCRLVCKNWSALISTPEFAQLHLSRSSTSCLIIPLYKKRKFKRLYLIDPEYPSSFQDRLVFVPKINLPNIRIGLINSCNGLVCFSQLSFLGSNDAYNICVCNPVLREYIFLPNSPHGTLFDSYNYNCAFGFSHKTNQYKVVLNYGSNHRAEIYTLGQRSRSWRSIESSPYCIWNHYYNSLLNGVLHWLGRHSSCPFICSFDFVTEQFRAVPEPSEFSRREMLLWDDMQVGVIDGNLSICDYSHRDHVAIWVMRDYGVKESWSKDIVINHMSYDTNRGSYEPIMITGNGEILVIFNNKCMMLYNPKSEAFGSELKIPGVGSKFRGVAHVSSLISLMDVAKGENVEVLGKN